jgi:hypothetical protein
VGIPNEQEHHRVLRRYGQAPKYIEVYAPEDRRVYVARRVAPLIDAHASVSPLFLRFAIEHALAGELGSTRTLDLVLHYVEALREGRLDLNADDICCEPPRSRRPKPYAGVSFRARLNR